MPRRGGSRRRAPGLGQGPNRQQSGQCDQALAEHEARVNRVHGQHREHGHGSQANLRSESSPAEDVKHGQRRQVDHEAARLGDADRRLQRLTRLDAGQPKADRPDVGVQGSRPVIEHPLALADPGIIGEEALDVMLDRPLSAVDRCCHLQVVAAIAGHQRQVPATDPDRGPDRVANPQDRQPRADRAAPRRAHNASPRTASSRADSPGARAQARAATDDGSAPAWGSRRTGARRSRTPA